MPMEQVLKVSPLKDGSATLMQTSNVKELVTQDEYIALMKAEGDCYWLQKQEVVALINQEPTSDDAGRDGELRHILLIPLYDYIRATARFFHQYFAHPDTVPANIKSVTLKEME